MTEPRETDSEQIVRDSVARQNGEESKSSIVAESIDAYDPGLPDGEAHRRQQVFANDHESRAAFRDLEFTIEEKVARGSVVTADLSGASTHTGEFGGTRPTGRAVEFGAIAKYVVADGEKEGIRVYCDTRGRADHLGLTVPTVLARLPTLAWRKPRAKLSNRCQ